MEEQARHGAHKKTTLGPRFKSRNHYIEWMNTLSSPVAFSQNTHISANDIATSLLNQLKNSGLTLSPLLLPFDTTAQSQRTIMPGQHTTNANSTFSTMHSNTSTNTFQRDNLISQPSTQVTFQPPLISDTECLQLNNDNADCYIWSVPLLKNSIPLGLM